MAKAMRIALIHNDNAGHGTYSREDLARLLSERGYQVDAFGKTKSDIESALATKPNVVVASGGDGTVASAAVALRMSDTPMFILPTGTSNNIARAVGADGPIISLVNAIANARPTRLDVARVQLDGREKYFVEGAGFGFIGLALEHEEIRVRRLWNRLTQARWTGDHWARTARHVARLVRRQPVHRLTIVADQRDLSGDYIAAEVLNIPAIGPRILLAPDANPGDAHLELLLIRPEDREAVADFIEVKTTNRRPPLPLATRRVRRVELTWPHRAVHVDDEFWPRAGKSSIQATATIELAGAVSLLVPPTSPM